MADPTKDQVGDADGTGLFPQVNPASGDGSQNRDFTDAKKIMLDKYANKMRMTKSFVKILSSTQLDEFFNTALEYCNWFLRVNYLEKQKATNRLGVDFPSNVPRQLGDNTQNLLFGSNVWTLDEAVAHKESSLRAFATAYCFLLLVVSANSKEPAKERMYFEVCSPRQFNRPIARVPPAHAIYDFTKSVDRELNRLFRSDLFMPIEDEWDLASLGAFGLPAPQRAPSFSRSLNDLQSGDAFTSRRKTPLGKGPSLGVGEGGDSRGFAMDMPAPEEHWDEPETDSKLIRNQPPRRK
ncbi:uncharacterized protein BJ171DRAFT_476669 [Polychytrium aggregatum]|uniref:uncharacterized protein n=1 Tax=Polychytrium aggregatum TaxID=110093 RepID=UPI0022FDD645|nr:uncharacterized protein BJ171DRAFT_476669 [Polychytrium aggregatum]KAI9202462.1 hypothetical protein BJ171DRAFT_476669 [Polychytrium aggregatum]